MRRSVLFVASLAACGRPASSGDDRDRPRVPPIAAVDEHCDPAHSRQCLGNDVVACEPGGVLGRRIRSCRDGCEDGKCVATCADDGVGLIYVVDAANEFLSFDPRKLPGNPFQRIGTLQCGNAFGSPFSMSVDRHGVAWVVYDGGELFKVSITDATCRPTAFTPGGFGAARFGMGFVSDAPGSATEKLFIAAADDSRSLASIDTGHSLVPHVVGAVAASEGSNPELTGTSEARLYGFFPMAGKPSFVQEIDRASGGARGRRWMLGQAPLGDVSAYAFAQWAGVFYVFVTSTDDRFESNSTVRAVDRATGTYRVVLDHLPYRITGAGVSTCAPERDQ